MQLRLTGNLKLKKYKDGKMFHDLDKMMREEGARWAMETPTGKMLEFSKKMEKIEKEKKRLEEENKPTLLSHHSDKFTSDNFIVLPSLVNDGS